MLAGLLNGASRNLGVLNQLQKVSGDQLGRAGGGRPKSLVLLDAPVSVSVSFSANSEKKKGKEKGNIYGQRCTKKRREMTRF